MNPDLQEDALKLPVFFRGQIRALLPERAFLRRDRDGGLFITNAPRFTQAKALAEQLQAAGFLCTEAGGLLRISPGPRWLTDFELRHEPPDHFCKTLVRFRGATSCGESVSLFSRGVQLLENADSGGIADYLRQVRGLAAVSLRISQGGVYACALIAHIFDPERSIPQ